MKRAILTRERSEEEKVRRHLYGDKGATFASKVPKIDVGGIAGTVTTFVTKEILIIEQDMAKIYKIRKLTPRECFRLMGVSDGDIDKIQAYPFHELLKYPSYSREEKLAGMTEEEKRAKMKDKISESQQYKLAGNSIVVPVLEGVFTQMFRKDSDALF